MRRSGVRHATLGFWKRKESQGSTYLICPSGCEVRAFKAGLVSPQVFTQSETMKVQSQIQCHLTQ